MSILQTYGPNYGKSLVAQKNIESNMDSLQSHDSDNSAINVDTFLMSDNSENHKKQSDLEMLKIKAEESVSDKKGAVNRMKVMKIARKIAKGEYVSGADLKFIKETDSSAYSKAKLANFKREHLEMRIKYKEKTATESELRNEEIHALANSDKEQADYSAEGIRELKRRKKLKIHGNSGINSIDIKA